MQNVESTHIHAVCIIEQEYLFDNTHGGSVLQEKFLELNQEGPAEASFCVATDEQRRSGSGNCLRKIQTKMSTYVLKHSQRCR